MQAKRNQVWCSQHPDGVLNRIDPDRKSQHHAYCAECLIEKEDGHALYKKYLPLTSFIEMSAASFAQHKEKIAAYEQPEKTYLDVLAGKAESLSRLSVHLTAQKEKTNKVYDELKSAVVNILEKNREADLQVFDHELQKLNAFYEDLEKTVNMAFPTKEELEKMLPSIEDIQKQLGEISEPVRLQEFLHNIKQKLSEVELRVEMGIYNQDERKDILETLTQNLKEEELKKPILDLKFSNVKLATDEAQAHLNTFFEPLFTLKNSFTFFTFSEKGAPIFPSQLAKFQDLKLIRSWLPDKFKFYPKLLYRASKDGPSNERFHQHCDGKGPTITIIHCLFDGAKESTVIGGFLEKNWNSNQEDIESDECFLFSLSSKIKCPPIRRGYTSAYGHKNYGPSFCGSNSFELAVSKQGDECYLEEKYFKKSAQLANIEIRPKRMNFKIIDYEVFALNRGVFQS